MKKLHFFKPFLLIVLVSVLTFLSFTGCSKTQAGNKAEEQPQQPEVKILATFYPLYIMLMNITDGVPGVKLSMLAPADTGCLHDYQLTTRDMKALEKCDILVVNGAGMEDFLEKALSIKQNCTIIAAQGYPVVDDNPHIWVSPSGAQWEVNRIAQGLSSLDPDHKDLYMNNAETYNNKIESLKKEMHQELDRYAGTKVITFHEAFPYFASEFNLNLAAVIERDAGTEPNARELAQLVKLIKAEQSASGKVVLFAEPQYSSTAAEVIAHETGLTVGELDPSVTGSRDKDAYLNAMKNNLSVLKQFLGTAE